MTDFQSHTKNDFFCGEKVGKHMTILQAANCLICDCLCTLPSQALCIFTTVCIGREDSAQQLRRMPWSMVRQSIVSPGGNNSYGPTSDRGRDETTHPRKDCVPRQRGSFRHHLRCHAALWCKQCSLVSKSDIFECQGHVTFLKCLGHNTF